MTDEQVEKIIKANMSLQMNLAGIRSDFEEAVQRKPWVGLTNQELIDLTAIYSGAPLYCAIEAKLREKNT